MVNTAESKKILLVEDEAIIALNETAMLESHGYSVVHAYSGAKAVQKVHETPVDLILMDIDLGLGLMSGTEAAQAILKEHDIPIVFLTSHTEKDIVEKVRNITSYGYVVKNSGEFVLHEAIIMAFELFNSHRKLHESEEKYRAAFTTSPDAISISTLDGVCIDINEGYVRMSGYTCEEVLGRNVEELGAWANLEDRAMFVRMLKQDGVVDGFETGFCHSSGEIIRCLLSARILDLGGEQYILSIARDVTEYRKVEARLSDSEKLHRSLVQASFDAYLRHDFNGHIREVNNAACAVTGYTREELESMRISDLDVYFSLDELQRGAEYIRKWGGAVAESRHKRKDGSEYTVSIVVTCLPYEGEDHFVSFFRDLSR